MAKPNRPPLHPSTRLVLVRHGQAGGPGIPFQRRPPHRDRPPPGPPHRRIPRPPRHRPHNLAAIYTSPHRRAHNSARALQERIQQTPRVDQRLVEFRLGYEDTQSIEEIVEELRYLMLWRPHDKEGDGGETLGQFQARVSSFLDEVSRACLGKTAVIFTHGGTIAAVMRWAYGLTPDHDWHSDVELFNASITEIEYWPDGRHPQGAPYAAAVHRLNDVRHLPPHLVTEY